MASLHGLVGQLALVLSIIAAVWAAALAVARRPATPVLYGLLVWVLLTIGGGGALGILLALTTAPPADPLHILYGLLAAGALPATALVARDRPTRQQGVVLAVGLVVLVLLVVRLLQTGG